MSWTPVLRRKIHPRRVPDETAAGPGPALDRSAVHARLAEAHRTARRERGPLQCASDLRPLVQRARALLDRDEPSRELELDVEAARAALVGLPAADPFDAVASDLVGFWIAAAGFGFAVRALEHTWRYEWRGQGKGVGFAPRPQLGAVDPDNLGGWTALRIHLVTADATSYAQARAAAQALRDEALGRGDSGLLLRCALSYAFPGQDDWVDTDTNDVVAAVLRYWGYQCQRHLWCLVASVSDTGQAQKLVETACARAFSHRCADFAPTLLDHLGAEALGPLQRLADAAHTAEHRKRAADTLALVESAPVASFFAGRLSTQGLAGTAAAYLSAHPALAVPALCPAVKEADADPAAQLLADLAVKHPDVVDAARGALDDVQSAALERVLRRLERRQAATPDEEAAEGELPKVLREEGRKRSLPTFWDAQTLPRPVLRNGRALPVGAVDRLGHLLALSTLEKPDRGLAQVREACTPDSLAELAWALCWRWQQAEAPAKDKWALYALAFFGGDAGARRLAPLILEWPPARAAVGIEVLGAIGSDVALTHAGSIGEKTKSKALKRRVEELMQDVAKARGQSADELADRIVPDLGLGDGGARVLDFGPRQFRVGFDAHLKPFVMDESGKRLNRLPPPGKADDGARAELAQREWKGIKGDAELVLKAQVKRLESAMCVRRTWKAASFRFLCGHPLLGHLARRLVWEAQDRAGEASGTFRVAEDGSFAGPADAPCDLAGLAQVRIPHPLEIAPGIAQGWRSIFADYEIVQPFAQLERPFHVIAPQERDSSTLARCEGSKASSNRLLGIRHRGWRGGWEYGGSVFKKIEGTDWTAVLTVAGDGTLGRVMLQESGFEDGRPVAFGELDSIAFSEIVCDLEWLKG